MQEMMGLQGRLSIEHMCQLGRVTRSGFYRFLKREEPREEETEVRHRIQAIVLDHRWRYGYRRVAAELRRQGLCVNHKRVLRIMRNDNLLSVRPRAFRVTTESKHELEVYLNLARRMKLTGINQLWVADITYIHLRQEFVYLAVILDGYSRKVVGWALDRSLSSALPRAALERALAERKPAAGLVHHSDRGLQYAAEDYVQLLRQHQIQLSMSRAGNPYDNASCESFIKTLKQEEIYCHQYRDMEDLRDHSEEFIERYYNCVRLHSALGYRPPEEFEQWQQQQQEKVENLPGGVNAAQIEFSRSGKVAGDNGSWRLWRGQLYRTSSEKGGSVG